MYSPLCHFYFCKTQNEHVEVSGDQSEHFVLTEATKSEVFKVGCKNSEKCNNDLLYTFVYKRE